MNINSIIAFSCCALIIAGCAEGRAPRGPAPTGAAAVNTYQLPQTEHTTEQSKYLIEEHNFGPAWEQSLGSDARSGRVITVAVLDSGRTRHSDMTGQYTPDGYDFVKNDEDPFVTRSEVEEDTFFGFALNDHGTSADSVIAAKANNFGITGVAPEVRILPLRVFTEDGFSSARIISDAIYYAITQNVDVISMSLTIGFNVDYTQVREATALAASRGIIVVAAAGNSGVHIGESSEVRQYPASYPWVISVGATERIEFHTNDHVVARATFSNYGEDVNVYARGVNVLAARGYEQVFDFETFTASIVFEDVYRPVNGTSFSTPMVAGLMAIAKSIDENLTTERALELLRETSEDFPPDGPVLLNAGAFIEAVAGGSNQQNQTPPSGSGGTGGGIASPALSSAPAPTISELTCETACQERERSLATDAVQVYFPVPR